MPLDNKYRIGPLAGAPQTRVRWSSALRLNQGFITEDATSPVSVTLKLPEVGKNPVDTAYDVGQWLSVLDVGSSSQLRSVVSLWFLLMHWMSGRRWRQTTRLFDQPASLRPIIPGPYQSPSAARTAAGCVLGHLSLNIVYQSHQIRLDSRTALVLMLLNSPQLRN
ncbi:hypothetical protein TNCV_4402061 [Trichonephila clavipes]|nr:hypothetical protein TNCV_4402061 [Trichonephila clavipes]